MQYKKNENKRYVVSYDLCYYTIILSRIKPSKITILNNGIRVAHCDTH
jgi:hypothetical protein